MRRRKSSIDVVDFGDQARSAIAAARAALDRHFPETQAFEPEGPETQAPDQDRRVAHG